MKTGEDILNEVNNQRFRRSQCDPKIDEVQSRIVQNEQSWIYDQYDFLTTQNWFLDMTPIEQIMYLELRSILKQYEWENNLQSQVQIGDYRVDFLIDVEHPTKHEKVRVVIECDGHDYHERTKKQASHDKRRDRYFQSQGFFVLRFSGSDIWNNSEAYADEVFNFLDKKVFGR